MNASPFDLSGETVLLTGAVGGLGQAMARELAAAGAALVLNHLDDDHRAAALLDEIRAAGGRAVALGADVTEPEQVAALFARAHGALGRVTVLVNNAGMMEEQPFPGMDLEHWNRTLLNDLTGPMVLSRQFVDQAGGRGAVVNVSSQLAFKGARNFVAYSAAKAGIVGLTRALARELGPGIRVNAVAPGPVVTPLIADLVDDPAWVAERTAGAVTGAIATPEQVAPVVVFLASRAATLLHGQVVHANGGGVMM